MIQNHSKSDQEILSGTSAQVYTLAHAVRPNKKCDLQFTNRPKHKIQHRPRISGQIKEELNKFKKSTLSRQPRSHLPMKMIVSKMATRKSSNDENADPASKIDISKYRNYPLQPPPWLNKLPSTKRKQTTELEKIILNMKDKCAELHSSSQHLKLKGQSALKQKRLENLLSDCSLRGCDVLNTPKLNYNYNQLYRGSIQSSENLIREVVLDEDPIGDDDSTSRQTRPVDNLKNIPSPSNPESLKNDVPEFVWNPVVTMHNESKYELFSQEEAESDLQQSPYQHLLFNRGQEPPSCFDTPTWESSSTSSDHTIEERLQLTIFASRGDMSLFGRNFL